jgi:hypothetical protein
MFLDNHFYILVIIQLIAASAAGRDLHYFTFGDKKFAEKITGFVKTLNERNVSFGKLYYLLVKGGTRPDGYFMLEPFNYIVEETTSSYKRVNHIAEEDGYEFD